MIHVIFKCVQSVWKNHCHQTNSPFCHDWMISGLWLHLFRSEATFERLDDTSRAGAPYWPYVETPKETKKESSGEWSFPKIYEKATWSTCKCKAYVGPSRKFCCRTTDPTAQHGLHCHPNLNSSGSSALDLSQEWWLLRSNIRSGTLSKDCMHWSVWFGWSTVGQRLVNGWSHMSSRRSQFVTQPPHPSRVASFCWLHVLHGSWPWLLVGQRWSQLDKAWQGLTRLDK